MLFYIGIYLAIAVPLTLLLWAALSVAKRSEEDSEKRYTHSHRIVRARRG